MNPLTRDSPNWGSSIRKIPARHSPLTRGSLWATKAIHGGIGFNLIPTTPDAENGEDGTNRYTTNYGITYDINSRTYTVAGIRFEHDQYGTYRDQWIAMTGLGRHFYETNHVTLQRLNGSGLSYNGKTIF